MLMPHSQKACKIGIMLFPLSDKQYSLGGTSGYSVRVINYFFSKWIIFAGKKEKMAEKTEKE